MTMPGSHSLFQPCSPHCPCQEETTELQWGWRHQSQDMEKQHWKNPTWCSGAVKTFTLYGMILHEPATTAKNKPGIHRAEWLLSINLPGWQRLHFPWVDWFFQNLGSIDPSQNMTNSAAVSHVGCVSLTTQQKQSDCPETASENNFISFHCQAINYLKN